MFHIHRWSKWRLMKSSIGYQFDRNERTCKRCGITERKFTQ